MNTILIKLHTLQEVVKEDLALNAKVLEATDAYINNSANLTKLNTHIKGVIKTYQHSSSNLLSLAEMLREANVIGLMHTLEAIQNTVNAQGENSAPIVLESPFIPSPEKSSEWTKEEKETPSQPKGKQVDMIAEEPKEEKDPE
ncbi:hypothetical protein Tco_0968094 [Tanacetum coccineum]